MSVTKSKPKPKTLMLSGNVPVTSGENTPTRMAVLLWGPATVGKTVFAATAPGDKLWLSLGDQEHVSVKHRKDVHVANLSNMTVSELFKHMQSDNPFGLDAILAEHENIATVVLDSLTALTYRALQRSVSEKVGEGKGFTPTMMAPGRSAYGGRNSIVLECVTGLLRVTAKHNAHIVITAHEADPTMRVQDGKEIIDFIGVMLGGQLVNNMTWRLSEIWYMSQAEDKEAVRRIAIRKTRLRKPMKSRMFTMRDKAEFDLHYDAHRPDSDKDQMTIARWYNEWMETNEGRIEIPKPRKGK